jgi:molybdopterin synthase sulfur carrier subunit
MPRVWVPAPLRSLTAGREIVAAAGATVRAVLDDLERQFPGLRARLCQDGGLKPGLAVVVGAAVARRGLEEPVDPDSEVHFVQAIGGG